MKNDRLLSLDVLRGVDIFLLVGLQPVLLKVLSSLDVSFLKIVEFSMGGSVDAGTNGFWNLGKILNCR